MNKKFLNRSGSSLDQGHGGRWTREGPFGGQIHGPTGGAWVTLSPLESTKNTVKNLTFYLKSWHWQKLWNWK